MLCFYCKSDQHNSRNCNVYVTGLARKEIRKQRLCCPECTGDPSNGYNNEWCPYCYYYKKCYCCFSNAHHTDECPDRYRTPLIFAPNIDKDLLPRFMTCLSTEEKYSLFFKFPLMSLRVKYEKEMTLASNEITKDLNLDLFVADRVNVAHYRNKKNLEFSKFKLLIFYIKVLEINLSSLSSQEFLRLISVKTRIIRFRKVLKFTPKLKLREILKTAPKLQEIDIYQSNVVTGNSWAEDLQIFAKSVKKVFLKITEFNFNVKILADLIKTRNIKVFIYIAITPNAKVNEKVAFNNVKNKLLKYFMPAEIISPPRLTVSVTSKQMCTGYVLKNC